MIGSEVYLRPVTLLDAKLLFDWRNEEVVRKSSFQANIIDYEEHKKWLIKILENKNLYFFIMLCGSRAIGQVRLDIENCNGIINYSIARQYRGMGYGKMILQLIENEIARLEIAMNLIGYVKKDNIASQKIFEQLGYTCKFEKLCFKYTKKAQDKVNLTKNVGSGGGAFSNQ